MENGAEMGIEENTMEPDLRNRVVALEHKALAAEPRLAGLEAWQRQMDIFNARKDEQFKNLTDRFDTLDKKIDNVSGGISKVLWLVGAAVVAVVVGFALKGGFIVP